MKTISDEAVSTLAKTGVGISGALAGMTINELVALAVSALTGVYLFMQIGLLLPKYWRCLSLRRAREKYKRKKLRSYSRFLGGDNADDK
jgi:hypothetical protein